MKASICILLLVAASSAIAGAIHPLRVLLGHSMGGTVALLFLERPPEVFDGAILSAPMLQIITDPLPEWVARGAA